MSHLRIPSPSFSEVISRLLDVPCAILVYLLGIALFCTHAAAAQTTSEATLLKRAGDWSSYVSGGPGRKICFAETTPATREPSGLKRGPGYLFITHRPGTGAPSEIAVIFGFPLKPGTTPKAHIGDRSFDLYAENNSAWPVTLEDQRLMKRLMRSTGTIRITSISRRGNKSINTYSLKGFGESLDRIDAACMFR